MQSAIFQLHVKESIFPLLLQFRPVAKNKLLGIVGAHNNQCQNT